MCLCTVVVFSGLIDGTPKVGRVEVRTEKRRHFTPTFMVAYPNHPSSLTLSWGYCTGHKCCQANTCSPTSTPSGTIPRESFLLPPSLSTDVCEVPDVHLETKSSRNEGCQRGPSGGASLHLLLNLHTIKVPVFHRNPKTFNGRARPRVCPGSRPKRPEARLLLCPWEQVRTRTVDDR